MKRGEDERGGAAGLWNTHIHLPLALNFSLTYFSNRHSTRSAQKRVTSPSTTYRSPQSSSTARSKAHARLLEAKRTSSAPHLISTANLSAQSFSSTCKSPVAAALARSRRASSFRGRVSITPECKGPSTSAKPRKVEEIQQPEGFGSHDDGEMSNIVWQGQSSTAWVGGKQEILSALADILYREKSLRASRPNSAPIVLKRASNVESKAEVGVSVAAAAAATATATAAAAKRTTPAVKTTSEIAASRGSATKDAFADAIRSAVARNIRLWLREVVTGMYTSPPTEIQYQELYDIIDRGSEKLEKEGYYTVGDLVADVQEPDFKSDLRSYGFQKRFVNEVHKQLQALRFGTARICGSYTSPLSQVKDIGVEEVKTLSIFEQRQVGENQMETESGLAVEREVRQRRKERSAQKGKTSKKKPKFVRDLHIDIAALEESETLRQSYAITESGTLKYNGFAIGTNGIQTV